MRPVDGSSGHALVLTQTKQRRRLFLLRGYFLPLPHRLRVARDLALDLERPRVDRRRLVERAAHDGRRRRTLRDLWRPRLTLTPSSSSSVWTENTFHSSATFNARLLI
jgi:hypothetical protein